MPHLPPLAPSRYVSTASKSGAVARGDMSMADSDEESDLDGDASAHDGDSKSDTASVRSRLRYVLAITFF